ncbi:hypothetical protein [Paenibacillus spiritus]|uniref:hypothetical protein n=1 Tax=Paenibacillus spiritus TaxID=2496557 RepID=UPI00168B33EB|nr:hypothetical protein [Paenibacillus spiritus]
MNAKMVKRKLQDAHRKFIASIDDEKISKLINEQSFITGGAIVSLLQNEDPNDYDYYFTTKEACQTVAEYFVKKFNKSTKRKYGVEVQDVDGRIRVFVPSAGVAKDKYKDGYKPVFLSSNAISLSNSVQLVIRFYGKPEEIHENYDFSHCTCYYIPHKNELVLPQKALESILTKELKYVGSKYPLASVVRSRKFIQRGWSINAGQYLKMILQCGQLDLNDANVLEEQLTGVDLSLFKMVIEAIRRQQEKNPSFEFTIDWITEVIDKVFDEEDMSEYIDEEEDDTNPFE